MNGQRATEAPVDQISEESTNRGLALHRDGDDVPVLAIGTPVAAAPPVDQTYIALMQMIGCDEAEIVTSWVNETGAGYLGRVSGIDDAERGIYTITLDNDKGETADKLAMFVGEQITQHNEDCTEDHTGQELFNAIVDGNPHPTFVGLPYANFAELQAAEAEARSTYEQEAEEEQRPETD